MLINSITDRLEEIIFHHVVYHPSFSHNLLSVGRLWQDYRIAVQFDNLKYLQCYSSGGRYRFTYDNGYNYIVPCQHLLRTMVSIPSIGDLGIVAIAAFARWFLAAATFRTSMERSNMILRRAMHAWLAVVRRSRSLGGLLSSWRVTHDCPHSIMTRTASMDAVHCRFGHCGHRRIRHMLSCDACMAGFGQHLSSYLCKPFPCKPFPVSFWHLL